MNEIHGLKINGKWLEEVNEVKEGIKEHFEKHFSKQGREEVRLKMHGGCISRQH